VKLNDVEQKLESLLQEASQLKQISIQSSRSINKSEDAKSNGIISNGE
jgi:hypothetical protein